MPSPDADLLLGIVRRHADTVLASGRGRGTGSRRDLFVDALEATTLQPPKWLHPSDGRELLLSNLANQQDLLRTLAGLSTLTGDPRYADAATAAIQAGFAHARDASGLLHWGGHSACDLVSGEPFTMGDFHELKCHYPAYDLMWAADPAATRGFIEAFWARHVLDWRTLDLNRHGQYGPGAPWTWPAVGPLAGVFFVGRGLSFINTGSDLVYAAALLAEFTGAPAPRAWAERLAQRYAEETRHPATGLGGYQFSAIAGDRADLQLGPEYGDRAREYSVLDRTRATRKFAVVGLCFLELAERLGPAGRLFADWAVHDLTAFARHAYDPATHRFHALLRDGTRLSPADVRRPGYYRPDHFEPYPPAPVHFWAYARATRLTSDPFLAEVTAALARDLGLGEAVDGAPQVPPTANDPWIIHGLLELQRRRPDPRLLAAASEVAAQLLRHRWTDGLFVEHPGQRFARLGRPEPLALLHLSAALRGSDRAPVLPAALPGERYFTAHWHNKGRTSDYLEWFPQVRAA